MRVLLLGPVVAVSGDDVRVPIGGARQRAVLAVLALHQPRAVSADRLIDEVWGDDAPAQALVSVRSYVANLRRALEPERRAGSASSVLVTDGAGYRLGGGVTVDAAEFEECLGSARAALLDGDGAGAVGHARAALDLWRGPALADLADESFARTVALRLDELRVDAGEVYAEARLVTSSPTPPIVADLEMLVAQHPLRERLWALLIGALYRGGRQADALRAFARVRRHLADELGLDPSPGLVAAERAVLDHDSAALDAALGLIAPLPQPVPGKVSTGPALVPAPFPAALARLAATPFMGRHDELTTAVGACVSPRHRPVVPVVVAVDGPVGIGKSRLAAAIARTCHDQGLQVLFGRWEPSLVRPYQGLAQAVEGLLAAQPSAVLDYLPTIWRRVLAPIVSAAAVPRLSDRSSSSRADTDPVDQAGQDRFAVLEAVAGVLRAASGPLAVVLEDVHWADEGSWALLEHLAGTVDGPPLAMVLTWRTGEGRAREMNTRWAELSRWCHVVRVALGGLAAPDLRDLVAATGGGIATTLPERALAAIASASEGNPFLALELARHLRQAETHDVTAAGLPAEVHAVLGARLDALPASVAATIRAAAVVGPDIDFDAPNAVTAETETTVLDHLDEAVRAELLVESGDVADRFRFAHGLLQEVALAQLTAARRRRLHHAAGMHLLSARTTVASRGALAARHLLSALPIGDADLAGSVAAAAGEDAFEATAYEQAADFLERAAPLAVDDVAAGERWFAAGRAHAAGGQAGLARQAFLRAAEFARVGRAPALFADAVLGVGGEWVSAGTSDTQLIRLLDEALAGEPLDDAIASRLLARKATACFFADDHAAAARFGADALRRSRRAGDDRGMAAAHHCQHLLARGRLPPARRLRLARSVTAHAERAGDTARVAVGLADQIFDHLEAGDVAAAGVVRRDYEDRAAHRRTRFDDWWLEVHRAMLALLEGRWDDAEIHTVSALSIAAPFDQPDAFAIHTAQLFALRWGQGRLEELAPAVTALANDPGGGPVWHAAAALMHAEAGRSGAVPEALAPVDADALMRAPRHGLWSATVALAVRSAALSAQRDRVRKLAPLLDHLHGRFVLAGPGVVCLGAVDHYRALVAGTVGRREDAVRLFDAARCHYDRAGAAPWQVWVDLDEARTRLATGGDPHDVAELVERASAGAATLAMPAAADALVALARPDRTRPPRRPPV